MMLTELATTHGYANVMVKGHGKQRAREWRRLRGAPTNSGKPNESGWQELATFFGKHGLGTVQQGGDRLVSAA